MGKGGRGNDFEMGIEWVVNGGLLYKVGGCRKGEVGVDIYEEVWGLKVYMVDLGVMGGMVKRDGAEVLIKKEIFKE